MSKPLPNIRYSALLGVTDTFRERAPNSVSAPYMTGNAADCVPRLRVDCPMPLGAYEQSVFLGAIAAVVADPQIIGTEFAEGVDLWGALEASDRELAIRTLATSCTWSALARYSGMEGPGGRSYRRMEDALSRLLAASCTWIAAPAVWSARLLSWSYAAGQVRIALHPHMARTAMPSQFAEAQRLRFGLVSLEERSWLRDPVARIVHAWLSCYVRNGRDIGTTIKLDNLKRHIWADNLDRRAELKRAMRLRSASARSVRLRSQIGRSFQA